LTCAQETDEEYKFAACINLNENKLDNIVDAGGRQLCPRLASKSIFGLL